MRSLCFPNMFNTNSTNVWQDKDYNAATTQNTMLLLNTMRGELQCDPYFGVLLEQYLFDQNSYILRDAIADIVYTQIALFIPQVHVKREDIKIIQDKEKGKLYCTFYGVNQVDYQPSTYNLVLYEDAEAIK